MVTSTNPTAIAKAAGTMQQLDMGDINDENCVKHVLVKFYFKDMSLIPDGIPMVDRPPNYQVDVMHQVAAIKSGRKELAKIGRARKGRVDTGKQVVTINRPIHAGIVRRGLSNNGFKLTHLHQFKMDDQKQTKDTMYVVVASFVRQLQNSEPESQHVKVFRELANSTWANCFVWDNPDDNPATVNFRGWLPNQPPKLAMVIRDGNMLAIENKVKEEDE